MEISVKGQKILITAGAAGIGRAMADVFHKAGARVHICDVVQASLDETVKALPGVAATLADVSSLKDVDRLFADERSISAAWTASSTTPASPGRREKSRTSRSWIGSAVSRWT